MDMYGYRTYIDVENRITNMSFVFAYCNVYGRTPLLFHIWQHTHTLFISISIRWLLFLSWFSVFSLAAFHLIPSPCYFYLLDPSLLSCEKTKMELYIISSLCDYRSMSTCKTIPILLATQCDSSAFSCAAVTCTQTIHFSFHWRLNLQ